MSNSFLGSNINISNIATEQTLKLVADELVNQGGTTSNVNVQNFPAIQNVAETDANFSQAMTNLAVNPLPVSASISSVTITDIDTTVGGQTSNLNVNVTNSSIDTNGVITDVNLSGLQTDSLEVLEQDINFSGAMDKLNNSGIAVTEAHTLYNQIDRLPSIKSLNCNNLASTNISFSAFENGGTTWNFVQGNGFQIENSGTSSGGSQITGYFAFDAVDGSEYELYKNYEITLTYDLTDSYLTSGANQLFSVFYGIGAGIFDINGIPVSTESRIFYEFIHFNGSLVSSDLIVGDKSIPISTFSELVPPLSEFNKINTFFFINYNGKFITGKYNDDGTREVWHINNDFNFASNDSYVGRMRPFMSISRDTNLLTTAPQQITLKAIDIKCTPYGNNRQEFALPVQIALGEQNEIPTNVTKLRGNTIDTGDGNSSAGTIRAVLATNQVDVPIKNGVAGNIDVDVQNVSYQENDAIGASSDGVLIMAKNSSNQAKPVQVNANGVLQTAEDYSNFQSAMDRIADLDVNKGSATANTLRVAVVDNQDTIPVSIDSADVIGSIPVIEQTPNFGTAVNNLASGQVDVSIDEANQTGSLRTTSNPDNSNTSSTIDNLQQQRVAYQTCLLSSNFDMDAEPNIYQADNTGWTITHDTTQRCVKLNMANPNTGHAWLNTKQCFNFNNQPTMLMVSAKLKDLAYTFVGGAIRTGLGLFRSVTGNFRQYSGVSWAMRNAGLVIEFNDNSGSLSYITSGSFNIDTFNGSGPSGELVDSNRLNELLTYVIDFNPLGRIRWGIIFDKNEISWAHEEFLNRAVSTFYFDQINNYVGIFGQSGAGATGGSVVAEFHNILLTTQSIDRPLCTGFPRTFLDQNGIALSSNTIHCMTAVRYDTTKTNSQYIQVWIDSLSVAPKSTSEDYCVALLLNPVINGVLTYVQQTNSPVEFLQGISTNSINPGSNEGIRLFSKSLSNRGGGSSTTTIIPDRSIKLGKNDVIALAVYSETAIANMMYTLNIEQQS